MYRGPERPLARGIAAVATAVGVLLTSGCASGPPQAPILQGNSTLPRCYDKPLSPQFNYGAIGESPTPDQFSSDAAYQTALAQYNAEFNGSLAAMDSSKIVLPFMADPSDSSIDVPTGEPAVKPSKTILNGIVKITIGKEYGSGFVTKDGYGDEVIVTTAHAAGQAPLDDIKITARNGQSIIPEGGCFIYETVGTDIKTNKPTESFASFRKQGIVDVDISVLTVSPKNKLNLTPLKIDRQQVRRGSWVKFYNYELNRPVNDPDSFAGLVVSSPPFLGFMALTGLSYFVNSSQAKKDALATRAEGGCSGGLVAEENKIEGVCYGSDGLPGYYDNAKMIDEAYNIEFFDAVYGFSNGFIPDGVNMDGPEVIEKALASSRA
jgi:hypothetical protein